MMAIRSRYSLCNLCFSLFLFGAALFPAADLWAQPESQPETGPKVLYHTLGYKVNDVQAEIAINGVPVLYGEYKEPASFSGLINMWVKPGKNVVTVRLAALKGPKKKDELFEFAVSVGRSERAATRGPRLAQFKWRSGESKEKLPLEKIFKFTPLKPPPSELWTKAEVLTLNPETRTEVEEFVQQLSQSFAERDAEALVSLLEFKFKERDRWLHGGEPPEPPDLKKEVEELLDRIEFQPVDMGSLEMHLVADGQLIWVTGKDFSNILQGKGGESKRELNIYLARIEGKWTLAR